jgi:hypothetical protein
VVTKNSWFQLRSEVLVQRYYDIITRNNKAKNRKGPVQTVLMASKQGAPNWHLAMGPSIHLQNVYKYAIQNNFKLEQVYSAQFDENKPTDLPEDVVDISTVGIGLDTQNELLADITTLHAIKPEKKPDFITSEPPFWTVAGFEHSGMPNSTWSQIETLATDDAAHTVPAVIQYDPSLTVPDIQKAWSTLWYHEHSRKLLDFASRKAALPLAVVVDASSKPRIEWRYWNPEVPFRGQKLLGVLHTKDHQLHPWTDICGGADEARAIFGDEEGAWKETDVWTE